ncbi:MAG TPA: ion channel [Vicinamibacteria bacterium]|nr:ion channel [Vicinamibacteria bacterium]
MFGLKIDQKSDRDLGFGSVVASRSAERLLNRDGTFNSKRAGLGPLASLHLYDALLTMRWSHFLVVVVLAFFATNAGFAVLYAALGGEALAGGSFSSSFVRAFFFSVHTLSTVGFGNIVPASLSANVLMTLESLVGLLEVAITTGLVFARFSRPTAKILFSHSAVVAPYRDGHGLMFRIANQKSTQLIELEAKVIYSWMENDGERWIRRFQQLPLERDKVAFFPLSWTVVHPIDKKSPLHGLTDPACKKTDAEVLILLQGIDETFSQTVHARSSYKADEIVWNARFTDIFLRSESNAIAGIDLGRLSEYERVFND